MKQYFERFTRRVNLQEFFFKLTKTTLKIWQKINKALCVTQQLIKTQDLVKQSSEWTHY